MIWDDFYFSWSRPRTRIFTAIIAWFWRITGLMRAPKRPSSGPFIRVIFPLIVLLSCLLWHDDTKTTPFLRARGASGPLIRTRIRWNHPQRAPMALWYAQSLLFSAKSNTRALQGPLCTRNKKIAQKEPKKGPLALSCSFCRDFLYAHAKYTSVDVGVAL